MNKSLVSTSPETNFARRHIGPSPEEIRQMLSLLEAGSLDALVDRDIPEEIRFRQSVQLPPPRSEYELLGELKKIFSRNKLFRSYIGMGYSDCITPPVIQRNIFENPGWYTVYTPYQPEISQGRLEALLNFQTMIIDLTGMEIANASLLDEATAAAEAMALCYHLQGNARRNVFFVSENCHPQTIDVVKTRGTSQGIQILVGNHRQFQFNESVFGCLLQYPTSDGAVLDYEPFIQQAHESKALAVVAADILSLILLKPPGEFGADVVVGSAQRFGVPMGYGGPHAAFFATRDAFKRQMPGRLVGISKDSEGQPALRLALQTREQHIRREKSTSNICTAQVLLAVMASMYAVWHGPESLRQIARRVHNLTKKLGAHVDRVGEEKFFDTIRLRLPSEMRKSNREAALALAGTSAFPDFSCNVRDFGDGTIGISLDETTTEADVDALINLIGGKPQLPAPSLNAFERKSSFLTAEVFNRYHTEHEMLRYIKRLEAKDLSLTTSMISLGSCTMKLNAVAEMMPLSWPEVSRVHPFAPLQQVEGYQILFRQLETWLAEITGFAAVSLQPNAGSQGEYTGLLAIREYHQQRGEPQRNVCLIPVSAHGTNPASAVLAGMKVVAVACDAGGDINTADLQKKAEEHSRDLAALMVTYPSTHGVFEEGIEEICQIVHRHGGQVYFDGANMNALVGLCRPADIGADVCHLNLHKTFCIPHGGGGPGMGPIAVADHLKQFLPGHKVVNAGKKIHGAVSAAPWGSASILTISWMYIALMGSEGLFMATKVAILNANYVASRLDSYFPVLFKGRSGLVAHECIVDLRDWKKRAGIEVEDVAKRLMDYGFHAPTMSWPVPGTLMIEPTESESKTELDRFCKAMISIHSELTAIELEKIDRLNNPLKNAPHTMSAVISDKWNRPYSREQAAFPAPWTRAYKFWPAVSRIDNVYGDRNLVCSCSSVEAYANKKRADIEF